METFVFVLAIFKMDLYKATQVINGKLETSIKDSSKIAFLMVKVLLHN